jgi:ankyrin repeat protein
MTPLHVAAGQRHKEMIIYLRQAGADLHAKKTNGLTAFHIACARGYDDVADLLFRLKADVHTTDTEGCTPIHSAAYGDHLSLLIKLIEEYGANPTPRSNDGSTPIHAAVVNNATRALQYLGQKANVDVDEPDNDGRRPVRLVVAENYFPALRCLFEHCRTDRMVVDEQGWTLLHVGASKGHLDVVQYLVQQGLSPNAKDDLGFTPLYYAAYSNRFECVEFLATVTTTEEMGGFTPIAIAATHGHLRIVQLLLTPANLNVRNHRGFTPLMNAAMNNQLAVVKELAIQGADLELATPTGHRALHLAAEVGALETIKFLVGKRRVAVDPKTTQGCTPLMFSVQNKHDKVAKWLVRKGDAAPRLDSECGTAVEIAGFQVRHDPSMRTLAHWLGRQCGHCGRWGRYQCDGCKEVYYCNTDCQRMNRIKHKTECGASSK